MMNCHILLDMVCHMICKKNIYIFINDKYYKTVDFPDQYKTHKMYYKIVNLYYDKILPNRYD